MFRTMIYDLQQRYQIKMNVLHKAKISGTVGKAQSENILKILFVKRDNMRIGKLEGRNKRNLKRSLRTFFVFSGFAWR